jgi:hypothetical protein
MKIGEKNSIVTFNNHGETQTLPLVTTLPSSTPAAAPAGPGGGRPGGPGGRYSPGLFNPGGGPGSRPKVGVGGGPGGTDNSASGNDGSNLRNVPIRNNTFNAASQIPEGERQKLNPF